MNKTNKIQKIAVIGTGYFSQYHFDAWKRLKVEVVGVCSLDLKKAKSIAASFKNCKYFSDYELMIKETKPSLIDIIIPPNEHLKIIKKISKYGINVICQKPFTNSLKDAKKVLNLVKTSKIKLIIHENFRFQPWHLQIRKMLKEKIIGNPYQITFKMRPGDGQGRLAYLNRQPYFQKMERFLIHETGIHFIDLFRFFFGNIKSVTSFLFKLNKHIKGEDNGIIFFEFKNGTKGLFDANRLSDHIAEDRRLTIGDLFLEGEKGTIRLDGNGNIFFRKFLSNQERKIKYKWFKKGFAGDSVYSFQSYIIECLKTDTKIVNQIEEYIKNIEIEEAIYKSNKLKKTVLM